MGFYEAGASILCTQEYHFVGRHHAGVLNHGMLFRAEAEFSPNGSPGARRCRRRIISARRTPAPGRAG